MPFRLFVEDGGAIPWTHRYVWRDPYRNGSVCLPMGIHWAVRTARRLWWWTHQWRPDAWEREFLRLRDRHRAEQAAAQDAMLRASSLLGIVLLSMQRAQRAGNACPPDDQIAGYVQFVGHAQNVLRVGLGVDPKGE